MFDFFSFIRKKWAEYSAYSGQKGTVVDDLAVKPSGLVLTDFYNMLVSQRRVNNIAKWKNMTEAELDAFGAKFFMPRIIGSKATGSIRMWFRSPVDINISTDFRASGPNSTQFVAIQPSFISKNSMKLSEDRGIAPYYVDIRIRAAASGDGYNLEAGTINQVTGINFDYVSVSNIDPTTNGKRRETNKEYYNRLIYAINDRSMMNAKSIHSMLPDMFPAISSIYIVGPGSRFMKRDLVTSVDLSSPPQKVSYLGKIAGDTIVRSIAMYEVFPPVPGNIHSELWGPHSVVSEFDHPLTIDPSRADLTASDDPALFGYSQDQEFTDQMYRGLFFDEFMHFAEVTTAPLFSIFTDNTNLSQVAVPHSGWIYGAHGYPSGNYGPLAEGVSGIDVLSFNQTSIILGGGSSNAPCAGIDIKKRTGVRLTGSFVWPSIADAEDAALKSNLQFMVGGVDAGYVDAYTGIGFGIRMTKPFVDADMSQQNAVIYFAHAEKYDQAQIYAFDSDISDHVGVTNLGALAERGFRIEPEVEYEFEFILHDDLRLTLYLNKTANRKPSDPTELENNLHFQLPSRSLSAFSDASRGGILAVSSTRYGTIMKVSIDTESQDPLKKWNVIDLNAADMAPHRATALYAINVKSVADPLTIASRSFGGGSVNGSNANGIRAFIWDKESTSDAAGETELTRGAWSEMDEITDPDGSKTASAGTLRQDIGSAERYRVQSRFGENIFVLIQSNGTSRAPVRYSGEVIEDIESYVRTDYIALESGVSDSYHANNKADIYVSTLKSSEVNETRSIVLTKNSGDSYFEMSTETGAVMPVADIISVTIGEASTQNPPIANSDFFVAQAEPYYWGSAREVRRIYLTTMDSDKITVEYTSMPHIVEIQQFFEDSINEKVIGDPLVVHKRPCTMSFTVYYTGNSSATDVVDRIKQYIDEQVGVFSAREMIKYLYDEAVVNNVKEPIEISFTRYLDNGLIETGTSDDIVRVNEVDFFRAGAISAGAM